MVLHRKESSGTPVSPVSEPTPPKRHVAVQQKPTKYKYILTCIFGSLVIYIFLLSTRMLHKRNYNPHLDDFEGPPQTGPIGTWSPEGRPAARIKKDEPSLGLFYPPLSPISPIPLEDRYYLVLGIATVARYNAKSETYQKYVVETIESLMKHLDDFFKTPYHQEVISSDQRILVFVQDNTIGPNPPFDELHARQRLIVRPRYDVLLYKNEKRFLDPMYDSPHEFMLEHPDHKIRQQNCDLISLTKHVLKYVDFDYFLFMEDDFITCDNMPFETLRVLKKLNYYDPHHCGLRISYGMNGLILPRHDLMNFIHYFSHQIDLLPIDLIIRWYCFATIEMKGLHNLPLPFKTCAVEGRTQYTYKEVLQEHTGAFSTFDDRSGRPKFPECGHSMSDVWNLDFSERFKPDLCGNWSITPCNKFPEQF
jgi:hypothetical protein